MFTRLFIQYLLMTVHAKRCSGLRRYLSEPHRWGPDFIESLGPSTEVGLRPPLATLELVFPSVCSQLAQSGSISPFSFTSISGVFLQCS